MYMCGGDFVERWSCVVYVWRHVIVERWSCVANILEEEKSLGLRKEGLGVVLDSELPHLIGT